MASSPSSSGIRMSISTTCGWNRAAWAIASSPLAASATTSMSGSSASSIRKPGADHRLVVDDEHPDGHDTYPSRGSLARSTKPVSVGPADMSPP